ncbi:ABC transporter ATP-binding protein [Rubrivirga sp. S365]|uniref:ABC transporter ATP-binding protein n=1 Tax=Rubrivirga sp. S365 TaxID=3076080 RepID=UPI0028CAB2DC|nr:ABC transporter ATP-binding protein [Rubrivirga sp. S365]MDT7856635.1 ABC transporter ATP-binding protein [Rubrivirga sp. S365]
MRKPDLSRENVRAWAVRARATVDLLWSAAPLWTVLWLALLAVQGVLPAALVALTKWVIDAMNMAVGMGRSWDTVEVVAVPTLLMGGVFLLQRVLGGVIQWVSVAQSEYVEDYVTNLVQQKASTVDFEFYEAPEYHDLMEQAQSQGTTRVLQLIQNGGSLLQTSVTLFSIGVILIGYGLWIPLALIVSAVPVLAVVLYYNRQQHTWWTGATPRRRRAQYYGILLTTMQSAAEVRMNRLDGPLIRGYRALRERLRSERLVLVRNQALGRFGAAVVSLLVTGVVMGWVVWQAFAGDATLGDLAAFYQAFTQAQTVTGTALTSAGAVYANSLFLRHLFDFLDLEPRVVDPPDPKPFPAQLAEGVRFEDVTFSYPGTTRNALEGFSLEIPAGKTVAIVGENGAGKSTFIKLLCRFYDPDQGRVTVDGTDLREFALADVRRRTAVLFQFPMRYQMTAEQNVRLGDPDVDPESPRFREAVVGAGADALVDRLPKGEETLLGRWFEGGVELSGGEWQRVALARAFYRESPLVILDEPTSFMDSWAENEWLDRFDHVAGDRTALIITHRFTTAMRADIIHVMNGGQIVESGTHDELVEQRGRYAESWATQTRQAGFEGRGDGAPARELAPPPGPNA